MTLLNLIFPLKKAYAHCDIPCGIYETGTAKMAAETVEKMVEKILATPAEPTIQEHSNFVRMVAVKEEYAQVCKREVLILWTDFFKDENLAEFPNLHDLVWKTTKLCSTNKREVSSDKAKALRENVDKIAEIFSQVKAAAKK